MNKEGGGLTFLSQLEELKNLHHEKVKECEALRDRMYLFDSQIEKLENSFKHSEHRFLEQKARNLTLKVNTSKTDLKLAFVSLDIQKLQLDVQNWNQRLNRARQNEHEMIKTIETIDTHRTETKGRVGTMLNSISTSGFILSSSNGSNQADMAGRTNESSAVIQAKNDLRAAITNLSENLNRILEENSVLQARANELETNF
uniref:Uncharacterized protein n=1 Tax=Vannella robusta TaxID=1487602 RepID=A0A7S4MKK8_9EUKA|mmetsp:Transcript_2534/g.3092  ORF Transcript_2534/g.3092 Transcript_2534/m.3092 type:complete len:201 (+) Transcript_2534:103-705(+)